MSRLATKTDSVSRRGKRKTSRVDVQKTLRHKQIRSEAPRRARKQSNAAIPPAIGDYLPHIHVGRLRTPADWLRQMGKVYRLMRRGEIPPETGTKLGYLLKMGAETAKGVHDSLELAALRRKLEEVGAVSPGQHLDALPALEHDDGGAT